MTFPPERSIIESHHASVFPGLYSSRCSETDKATAFITSSEILIPFNTACNAFLLSINAIKA